MNFLWTFDVQRLISLKQIIPKLKTYLQGQFLILVRVTSQYFILFNKQVQFLFRQSGTRLHDMPQCVRSTYDQVAAQNDY